MHLKNHTNEYAAMLGPLFDECPKSVLAACLVSVLTRGDFRHAALQVAAEWSTLHDNGIVPQRPAAVARALLKRGEEEVT